MANLNETRRTTLTLTRKSGQAIWIGESRVEVEMVNGRVKLHVTADENVLILREELRPTSES
jgi:sRNA-binding carbon storage regulator CsrA